jgi:FkbM family methyltransferase
MRIRGRDAESIYRAWCTVARAADRLPGVQSARTLAGLDSWRDRARFGRWIVERRLGLAFREEPAPEPRDRWLARDGYVFEPRDGSPDRQVLGAFHEVQTRSFVRRQLARRPPGGVFIDVGAHCGGFSIPFETSFATVIAIEPLPDNYRALERNIAHNQLGTKVRAFNVAAAEAPARARFFVDGDEKSSLVPADRATRIIDVEVRALDDLLREAGVAAADVRLIKIDVEGAELRVLGGARQLLAAASPIVILEANTPDARSDLEAFMGRIGYLLRRVTDGRNLCFKRAPR